MTWDEICRFCFKPLDKHEQCSVGGIIGPIDGTGHPHWKCECGPSGWLTRNAITFNSEQEAREEMDIRLLFRAQRERGVRR
jgi:hypothetical protein